MAPEDQCLLVCGVHETVHARGYRGSDGRADLLAACHEAGITLVVAELHEVRRLNRCAQLQRQRARVFGRAVECEQVVHVREDRVPQSPLWVTVSRAPRLCVASTRLAPYFASSARNASQLAPAAHGTRRPAALRAGA